MRLTLLLNLLLISAICNAQSPADWWYFGDSAGIHFTQSGPVADLDGELVTYEGCASVSSNSGDLLFYTDGVNVFDKNHAQMPNGFGLLGNWSSTQSSVVIPRPGSNTDYYIFTVDAAGGTNGLHYSRVDLTLNSGVGDVVATEKNVPLHMPASEKLTAIGQPNGFWVFVHSVTGDTFLGFEVTASGVNTTPVISNVGASYASVGWGYMKFAPEGDKLGSANGHLQNFELFDFDASTGILSNPITWSSSNGSSWYGFEFSPDGSKIYANEWVPITLVQFDISSGNAATIQASEYLVHSSNGGGAVQLGPDGKIYVARQNLTFLSCIQNPNAAGASCNYLDTAVSLAGRVCKIGLPTFNQSFFSASFSAYDHCFGEQINFSMDTTGVDSVFWNFGDPSSGSANTSTQFLPNHTYTDTGTYTVTLIAYSDTLIDTVTSFVQVYPRQSIDLGPDLVLCDSDTVILSAAQPFASFEWHDGSTADSFVVTTDVTAWVTVFGICDTVSDTINIIYSNEVFFDLGPDTSFCEGNSIMLNAAVPSGSNPTWNTGATGSSLLVDETGTYILTASTECSTFSDTIEVEVFPNPDSIRLPDDTINCFDTPIVLAHPNVDGVEYFWPDSTQKRQYEVDTTETVWLTAFNFCGFFSDTVHIIFNGEIQTELGEDTAICDEDSIILRGIDSLASYVWNTGDTVDSVVTVPEVSQNYVVTITLRACKKVEQRYVESHENNCPPIDCSLQAVNIFTPNGDGINDLFRIWSDCEIFSYDLSIYNRWGQLVHLSRNKHYGWDGYVNGEPASEGTYYYTVEFRDQVVVNADRQVTQGSFTLLRD